MIKRKTKPGAWHKKKFRSSMDRRFFRMRATKRKRVERIVRACPHEKIEDGKKVQVRRKPLTFQAFPEQKRATGALKRHERRQKYLDKLNQERA